MAFLDEILDARITRVKEMAVFIDFLKCLLKHF